MKNDKTLIKIVMIIFITLIMVTGCVSFAPREPARPAVQEDLYGTWTFGDTGMTYTISADTIIGLSQRDGTGFTVQITNWDYAENRGNNSRFFPNGFNISGTITEMSGSWMFDRINYYNVGDEYTWTWFLNYEKVSIRLGSAGGIYIRQ